MNLEKDRDDSINPLLINDCEGLDEIDCEIDSTTNDYEYDSVISEGKKKYKKRKRTTISPEQLNLLENLYEGHQWPSKIQKECLARDLGRSETFVSVWFQNKRARVKKEDDLKRKMDKDLVDSFSQSRPNDINNVDVGYQPKSANLWQCADRPTEINSDNTDPATEDTASYVHINKITSPNSCSRSESESHNYEPTNVNQERQNQRKRSQPPSKKRKHNYKAHKGSPARHNKPKPSQRVSKLNRFQGESELKHARKESTRRSETFDEHEDVDVIASDTSTSSTDPPNGDGCSLAERAADIKITKENVARSESKPDSNSSDTRVSVNKQKTKLTVCGRFKFSPAKSNTDQSQNKNTMSQQKSEQTRPIDLRVEARKTSLNPTIDMIDSNASMDLNWNVQWKHQSDGMDTGTNTAVDLHSSTSPRPSVVDPDASLVPERRLRGVSSLTETLSHIHAKRICFTPGNKQRSTLLVRLPKQTDDSDGKATTTRVVRTRIGVKVPPLLKLHKAGNTHSSFSNVIINRDTIVSTSCSEKKQQSCSSNYDVLHADRKSAEGIASLIPALGRTAPPAGHGGHRQSTLFHTLMNMVALAEGGLLSSSHQEYSTAVNDALYGILINNTHRLVYDKDYGPDLLELEHLR